MLILLAILVLLLHAWVILWLLRSEEPPVIPPQPFMMEVSMISSVASKPSVAPAPPTPAPPPPLPQPKIEPKKPAVKPIVKKIQPVIQKTPDRAPAQQVVEQPQSAAQPAQASPASDSKATASAAAPSEAEQFTQAVYNASYLHNPAPEYPSIAKSRGWQGKVKVRVHVSAEGFSEAVEIASSSGHEILDETALETVKKYRFKPAKRGETSVPDTVVVPIDFHFEE